ncbi:MAG: SUMF1/EgtB/PvdO family nonheme iron enzyme [Planctomycetes bacterium]|nr:SUMF1/EgtB/PvdO family nonheme iron enzyme [Planctomycetota bacterium]
MAPCRGEPWLWRPAGCTLTRAGPPGLARSAPLANDGRVDEPSPSDAFEAGLWAALDLPGAERIAALQDLAARHPDRAEALAALLPPSAGEAAVAGEIAPARQIGPYRVLGVLGEGGMGQVLLAEQDEPVFRRVAVKVIKRGMDSERLLARFQIERQALAMMDHPCIATVFDAGAVPGGQPYFAMEYVLGLPITQYCDRRQLPLRARLELFVRVCAGVEHAHQKGVLHRDLKPTNILVLEQDGQPTPKIIDFGLAKVLTPPGMESQAFTEADNLLGTVDYMSPEQVGLDGNDVDTRTDVYSLGVVLYELLVGELPHARRRLRQADRAEVGRAIREEEVQRPSTRVTSLGEAAAERATARRLDRGELRRRLCGDLDWIVLKALEKDRERRYGSAREFADDVRRHLAHEPVQAGPPGAAYRLRKFVRRHRTMVLASSLLLATAVAGAAATWLEAQAKARVLDHFLLLAHGVRLADAKREEADLYPALPEMAPALRAWLRDRAEPLLALLPELERLREEQRGKALPRTDAEIERLRAAHPRGPELAAQRTEIASMQRMLDVDAGRAAVPAFTLDAATAAQSAAELNAKVEGLVGIVVGVYGREPEALALARLCLQKVEAGDRSLPMAAALRSLAQACFRNGLFEETMQHRRAALDLLDDGEREAYLQGTRSMEASIRAARNPEAARRLADRAERMRALATAIDDATLRFPTDGDRFLHENLSRLVEDLREFAAREGIVAAARARLAAADTVHARSIDAHREAWDAAVAAIAAEPRYGGLRLAPQVGLVPLGPDPDSGLWEFVHLASGEGEHAIPKRGPEGRLSWSREAGIVFVLLPGGALDVGAQRDDPQGPNFDPYARANEPLRPDTLQPFLIGKHEVTQVQWARLMVGTGQRHFPSFYKVGRVYRGIPAPGAVLDTHPVESVEQLVAALWLQRSGMMLPTEAQWEYACRGGTTAPWWTGPEPGALAGRENLLDQTAARTLPEAGAAEPFDDGYGGTAPVGCYGAANPFGLHDMHGNVAEWVSDRFATNEAATLRMAGASRAVEMSFAVARGGSFRTAAVDARSARRVVDSVNARHSHIGVRAAMVLRGG